jgi:hypothetical protein
LFSAIPLPASALQGDFRERYANHPFGRALGKVEDLMGGRRLFFLAI